MRTLTQEDFQSVENTKTIVIPVVERNLLKTILNNIKKNPLAICSVITLTVMIIASIFADLSPHDPNMIDVNNSFQSISSTHWFGTDDLGRDYFSRALHGGRVTLAVGFLSMVLSTLIGIIIGVISGFFGGWIDSILMRFVDMFMSIPSLIIIIVINIYIKPGISTMILMISLFGWMGTARIVRAQTLTLKSREYVAASKNLGASSMKIIGKHIVPNMIPELIVASTITMARAILQESTLSFLGYGVSLPQSSWGSMLQNAQKHILDYPMLSIIPGLLILLVVLSLNILGDVIRQSMDKGSR